MLRTVTPPFSFTFSRSGGSLITARIDTWLATANGWSHVQQYIFSDTTSPAEQIQGNLIPGSYTCVFQCYVEESLNGKYSFSFDVNGAATYADSGDVNTTTANNDSKVFKDQFILEVK